MSNNMISKNQKHALLRNLLSNSLPVLCKNGLGIPDVQFSLEAFVGITVGEGEEVILVSIKETVTSEGVNISHAWNNPLEDDTNTSRNLKSSIKKEMEIVQESDVCDLTEEPDETDESAEISGDGRRFLSQNTSSTGDGIGASFASYPWMTKDDGVSHVESFIKKEHPLYNSKSLICADPSGEATGDDNEEDFLFSAHYSSSQNGEGPCLSRREGFNPRTRKGKRMRFMQRGRFRNYGATSNHIRQPSALKNQNIPGFNERSSCDDLALRSSIVQPNGAYQDLMKEMCEQVVSQSMSMETQYVCHICQARRCSKSSLMDHIRGTHLAMDKYTCGECGERFRWFMQLHRHRKKFHPEPGDDFNMGEGDFVADEGNY